MENNGYIIQLIENRRLTTYEEHVSFMNAMEALSEKATIDDVSEICKSFFDDTLDDETMFSVIHLIEKFRGEQYLKIIAVNSPQMLEGHNWAMTLNKRIINSSLYLDKYIEVIQQLEKGYKEKLLELLIEIKNDNPQKFGDKIDRIVKETK